ncbi:MAG TPA: phosphotransferase, partial [Candidatus Limnocylindrales bacterium]|nr:phosphotransferase [Candidatus Limnocylindrales bacterium]
MARPPTQIDSRPGMASQDAAVALRRWWRLDGDLEALPSERDQNFLVRDDAGRPAFVLKIANLEERHEFLDCQDRAMAVLSAAGIPVQPIRPTVQGLEIAGLGDPGPPWARVFGWLPGRTLATVP